MTLHEPVFDYSKTKSSHPHRDKRIQRSCFYSTIYKTMLTLTTHPPLLLDTGPCAHFDLFHLLLHKKAYARNVGHKEHRTKSTSAMAVRHLRRRAHLVLPRSRDANRVDHRGCSRAPTGHNHTGQESTTYPVTALRARCGAGGVQRLACVCTGEVGVVLAAVRCLRCGRGNQRNAQRNKYGDSNDEQPLDGGDGLCLSRHWCAPLLLSVASTCPGAGCAARADPM